MSDIVYNAIRTPDGTILESHHRHDYKTHDDANGYEYMVDGGLDYVRSSANGDEEYLTVSIDDSHELVRESVKWGTYGINGDQPLTHIKLSEMDTDHIEACLGVVSHMCPQYRTAMNNELEYRTRGTSDE